jgi:hypothetical protein
LIRTAQNLGAIVGGLLLERFCLFAIFFNHVLDGVRVVAGVEVVIRNDNDLACMLVLQICRGSHGVLHLHFVNDDHDRYGGVRNGHGAPRSGWCSQRRLAHHRGDDRGCIARASDRIRLRLFFARALHLADALRTEIGGAVVERIGVFR